MPLGAYTLFYFSTSASTASLLSCPLMIILNSFFSISANKLYFYFFESLYSGFSTTTTQLCSKYSLPSRCTGFLSRINSCRCRLFTLISHIKSTTDIDHNDCRDATLFIVLLRPQNNHIELTKDPFLQTFSTIPPVHRWCQGVLRPCSLTTAIF